MDTNGLTKVARQLNHNLTKHSPTILTALGIAGFVSTVIMAIKATPKAIDVLERERHFRHQEYGEKYEKSIDVQTTVELTWKFYAPTVLMGVTSIACVIGASSINHRRNVALSSLFAVAESTLKDYQAKVIETVGDKKEQKIREAIVEDNLKNTPLNPKAIIVSGLGDTLCQDLYTGRYFKGDVENIRKAVNDFNRRLLSEMRLPLNDLYSDIGLDPVDGGEYIGWDVDKGLVEVEFYAKLASGNVPCVVISFHKKPVQLW